MIYNKKYQKKGKIGRGLNGIVSKVLDITDNKLYALKIIEDDNDEFEKEVEIMKNIKSEYIIKLKDNFYEENEGYCLVMELCDGDLRQILKENPKGLPLNIINKIFNQLNDALKAMIDIDYVHRDLKPENILIKYTDTDHNINNFDIKLTDFGLSKDQIHSSIKKYTSKVGTKIYMAPEIEKGVYNNKCDLWSLGIILYELYTNKYIFDSGENNPEKTAINRYRGKIVNETDNEMINKLIRNLIQVDIDKRIGWEKYFNDDFFKKSELNGNIK